jgi:hypothetical protein
MRGDKKMKKYITLAIALFFFAVPIIGHAGSWNISSGPEYGVDTGTKYSTQRNYIKLNGGYEKQLSETWSGELEFMKHPNPNRLIKIYEQEKR